MVRVQDHLGKGVGVVGGGLLTMRHGRQEWVVVVGCGWLWLFECSNKCICPTVGLPNVEDFARGSIATRR